jgi:hypothetical protein
MDEPNTQTAMRAIVRGFALPGSRYGLICFLDFFGIRLNPAPIAMKPHVEQFSVPLTQSLPHRGQIPRSIFFCSPEVF